MRAVSPFKKALVFGAVVIAVASTASAQVLACDQFSYADGSLVPNGGWANHSGTAGDLLVSGGQVVVQHGVPSEDANVAFTTVAGNIYYGVDFSVDDLGAPYSGTDNEYFAHFRVGTDFAGRLDVVAPTGAGDYSVGIASDDSVADAIWATDLTYGTTYRAIVRYDQAANIAELWIDATVDTDTSILGDDQPDPGDTPDSFALRQSDSSENETVRVDNVVVGQTFGDVTAASCGVVDGTQTPRPGMPPNPGTLNPGSPPNIGTTWNPTVSAAGIADILILSTLPGINVVTPFGTLLCNLPGPAFILVGASGLPFAVPIPNDPAIVGLPVCTQGAGFAPGLVLTLTNALDLVLGG